MNYLDVLKNLAYYRTDCLFFQEKKGYLHFLRDKLSQL